MTQEFFCKLMIEYLLNSITVRVKDGKGFRRSEVTKKRKSDIHLVLSFGSGSIVSHLSSRWFCYCLGNRVVGRLKSMDILLMPFHLCWELFWRKLSQEHLTHSQTTYDRRSPICESESCDRTEFSRLRTQNWGSGWLLGLMEVRRDWYGWHTSYNLKGLKLCNIDWIALILWFFVWFTSGGCW